MKGFPKTNWDDSEGTGSVSSYGDELTLWAWASGSHYRASQSLRSTLRSGVLGQGIGWLGREGGGGPTAESGYLPDLTFNALRGPLGLGASHSGPGRAPFTGAC